ncbi:MAG: LD-carboxypeptidase [Lentisphaeria bacterium]|nr:MAG: LD-carboxypeptidase [Lentisphaeria bacterium]
MQMIPEQFKTIAVAAPAGPLAVERFTDGVNWLRATGKMLRIMPHVNGPSSARYLAASAEARAADLSAAWLDPEVDLLLAARGGFPVPLSCSNFWTGGDWPPALFCRWSDTATSPRFTGR